MIFAGQRAVVTGASRGIGETFARALARRGMQLLLTALPEHLPELEVLASELRVQHHVSVEPLGIDLGASEGAYAVKAAADAVGFDPDLLINNAGVGTLGGFAEGELARQLAMIRVNMEALVTLTGLFIPNMLARRHGAILNVASTAAFQPIPYFAVYAASKAFVLNFSLALWAEYHTRGVRVITVCPSRVSDTGLTPVSAAYPPRSIKSLFLNPSNSRELIVRSALRALDRDQPSVVLRAPIIGIGYYPATLAASLMPHRVRLRVLERTMRWLLERDNTSAGGHL